MQSFQGRRRPISVSTFLGVGVLTQQRVEGERLDLTSPDIAVSARRGVRLSSSTFLSPPGLILPALSPPCASA